MGRFEKSYNRHSNPSSPINDMPRILLDRKEKKTSNFHDAISHRHIYPRYLPASRPREDDHTLDVVAAPAQLDEPPWT